MKRNKLFLIGLFLVSVLYLFVRFYRLNELVGFRLDQGVHLLETKTMIDEKKIKLVGPMVTSKSIDGRNFFIGANYYYVLGLVGLVSNWDPLTITAILVIVEYIFYLVFVWILGRKFGQVEALSIFIFIAISPYLVIHSRFFWNPHLLIPLAIATWVMSEKYFEKKNKKYLFLMAFLWGFAFSCHYTGVFWGIFFIYVMFKANLWKDIKAYLIIILGFILGDLPWLVFEFRHNFYNIKTLFYIFSHSSQGGDLTSHYFIFPLLIWGILGLLVGLDKIKNKRKSKIILAVILGLATLLQVKIFRNYLSINAISGWSYPDQKKAVEMMIINGCPQDFEVAATVQGDTRAYDLRYLLNLKNCEPMGVEEYSSAKTLFLIAPKDRRPETETVWEVTSLGKFKIKREEDLNKEVKFYELEKD